MQLEKRALDEFTGSLLESAKRIESRMKLGWSQTTSIIFQSVIHFTPNLYSVLRQLGFDGQNFPRVNVRVMSFLKCLLQLVDLILSEDGSVKRSR